MNLTNQDSNLLRRYEFICTMPKLTAENVSIVFYGTKVGRGATRIFPPLYGKTLKVTDNQSTTTTEKTCTFTRSHFVNPEQPTLAEIVVAIEAAFHEAAHVTPSAGAIGELILTCPANVAGVASIGDGTANEILGFQSGVSVAQATGVTFTLPAEMAYPEASFLYQAAPDVRQYAYTAATGVRTALIGPVAAAAPVWTPAARTIFLEDGSKDAAGVVHAIVTF